MMLGCENGKMLTCRTKSLKMSILDIKQGRFGMSLQRFFHRFFHFSCFAAYELGDPPSLHCLRHHSAPHYRLSHKILGETLHHGRIEVQAQCRCYGLRFAEDNVRLGSTLLDFWDMSRFTLTGEALDYELGSVPRGMKITRSMAAGATVQAMFATTELLEQIMLHLPVQLIITSQRVCHQFEDLIKTYVMIRPKLFL